MRLTDLTRCKQLLYSGDQVPMDQHDALLEQLIAEISADVEVRLDRRLVQTTYSSGTAEYLDGTGTDRLLLAQGPVVTFTSLERLTYSKDGAGALVITATTVDAGDYAVEGLRSAGSYGCGVLRLYSGSFCEGTRNYRATYSAGFVDDVNDANGPPPPLVRAVTNRVIGEFHRRGLMGLISSTVGDASISASIPDSNWDSALDRSIHPYRRMRVA